MYKVETDLLQSNIQDFYMQNFNSFYLNISQCTQLCSLNLISLYQESW